MTRLGFLCTTEGNAIVAGTPPLFDPFRVSSWRPCYSLRSASTGSSAAARRAGIIAAVKTAVPSNVGQRQHERIPRSEAEQLIHDQPARDYGPQDANSEADARVNAAFMVKPGDLRNCRKASLKSTNLARLS
jgi:hypothetical protein